MKPNLPNVRLLAAFSLLPILTACADGGLGKKLPPLAVSISQDCEALAQPVAHAATYPGMDPRLAWKRETVQLDKANDNLDATRECQSRQRTLFGAAK